VLPLRIGFGKMTGQRERVVLFQQKRDVAGKGNAILHRDQRAKSVGGDEA
jgi:hypothetical protein